MINAKIQGIPCQIEVTHFVHVEPWKGSLFDCPSDMDYYGYTEIEFEVFDRKGYPADWLERKMTDKDREYIEMLIRSKQNEMDEF